MYSNFIVNMAENPSRFMNWKKIMPVIRKNKNKKSLQANEFLGKVEYIQVQQCRNIIQIRAASN